MSTFKYLTRLIAQSTLTILLVFITSLAIFIAAVFFLLVQDYHTNHHPNQIQVQLINDTQELELTKSNKDLLRKEKIWLMELNQEGQIVQSFDLPDNLKRDYQLNDVVRFTRWYLEDYPVFSYPINQHLLVLGYPKHSFDKFPMNYYRLTKLKGLFLLGLICFAIFALGLYIIYLRNRLSLNQELAPINQAIQDLQNQQDISLNEVGSFSEIKRTLNQTAQVIQDHRKQKDHWIRGVSHDLRNPLTLILQHSDNLANKIKDANDLQQIEKQVQNMQDIIENLNLSYILDQQELQQQIESVSFNQILRTILTDFINTYPDLAIDYQIVDQEIYIQAIPSLIQRAINNILYNSIKHNQEVTINIQQRIENNQIQLDIIDNGTITLQQVEKLNHKTDNYENHGLGSLISQQIIRLHHGTMKYFYQDPGLKVSLRLPLAREKQNNS
ncbi:Signal transduction histidine kinase [Ignavigranum ruoffiae]|uniref:histidine kinase n=1 Tax=Ignavigranum ruoffiae TaxID=89093 RepID=A0A1H9AVT2_9LACT|nr:HAMP domain-containing sensor histidine kinase [Ignavigranum ruoffiae]SEP80894.1 Signal transduction histidine kinase [Ignavigranum ruoffiae]